MIAVVPYESANEPAVAAFNARLAAGGVQYAFPKSSVATWLPPRLGARLWQDLYIAVEDDTVRGGYILKHQDFLTDDTVRAIGAFQLPLSEGTIERRYAAVGVQLLRDALRRQPLLYTLGIGSRNEAAARLLHAARFSIETVPFFFRVERSRPFLGNIKPLRTSRARRLLLDALAVTGIASVGIRLLERTRAAGGASRSVVVEHPAHFDAGVDEVWSRANRTFTFGAVRDLVTLGRLYDTEGNRFLRVVIHDQGKPCGWAVVLATRGTDHKYFGRMHVGSIVDLLAVEGYERALLDACVTRLRQERVDIIVTNQSLRSLQRALRDLGFLTGPSNFLLAVSPELASLTGPVSTGLPTFHFNRGDGDGPINL